ncbi:hypothetical protein [Shouchella clausii]|uniref:hypothetical protein n=1 Tax=Shouchella clausii TaxID=79880 RepID=UPI001C72A8DE|nr:hypothetical protein [Shouchella clausii]MBX0320160.1 hypothetical protein [Shouchella clausii]
MRVENLKKNMHIKNYRELCQILDIEVKAGNSKKTQLAELQRYCSYKKVGHAFYIEDIYQETKPRIDKRKNGKGNSVFSDIMQILILDTLVRERKEGSTIVKTRNQLLFALGAINEFYTYHQERPFALSEQTGIDAPTIKDFYETSNSNFKGILETALNALRKKSLLMYDKVNMVAHKNIYREAASEEKELILKAEIETLKELGLKDIHAAITSGKWDQFKKRQKLKLKELGAEFTFSYVAYRITANETNYLQDEFDYLLDHFLSDTERMQYLAKMNDLVATRLLTNAKRRHQKATENVGLGMAMKRKDNRQKEEYIDDFKKLIGLLVLREELKN